MNHPEAIKKRYKNVKKARLEMTNSLFILLLVVHISEPAEKQWQTLELNSH